MPLVALNLDQARTAYAALELRAATSDLQIATLQATVDALNTSQATVLDRANLLTQYTVSQAQSNAQLLANQAGQVAPDIPLNDFIAALGLAVALGEASMPDRAITSVTTSLQAYLTFDTAQDGSTKVGVRFYQPELGQPTALATATFGIEKIPPQPGAPAPRNLYTVLQSKQAVYTNPAWLPFMSGTPPVSPAAQVVTEVARIFANIGAWTFPYIVQEAAVIATLETTLAGLVAAAAPSPGASAYANIVAALANLASALNPANRSTYVAGDLYALTAALDATTRLAQTLVT